MVGEFGEVLVMDWGLAKILGRQSRAADVPALSPGSRPLSPRPARLKAPSWARPNT